MNCTHGYPRPLDSTINAMKSLAFLSIFLLSPGLVGIAHSQIFVSNFTSSTVSEYSLSGTQLSPSLISGLLNPIGLTTDGSHLFVPVVTGNKASIGQYDLSGDPLNTSLIPNAEGPVAISGDDLFVQDVTRPSSIGEYTTSGATVAAPAISIGEDEILGIAVEGNDVFVSYISVPPINGVSSEFTIGEYTTSGTTLHASLISGLGFVGGLAVQGNDLFLSNDQGFISEYATDGTFLKTLVPGLDDPTTLTLNGNDLFVANSGNGTISEYTTSGDPVAPSLITGLSGDVYGIAVVPEPATFALLALASGGFLLRRRCRGKPS